ncbi:MAG: hypothetical protein KKH97_09805 [Proteobacteria bacterium]|nr:hypothetical protein [Pseudomonadota bacterium]
MKNISLWEKITGFIFGVIFVSVVLVLAVFIPNPSPSQHETFKIVLALAAAGIGGILPGFININAAFNKFMLRAGGALALFLVVFFFTPAAPAHIPTPIINQTISGDHGTQIGKNEGVLNINTKDSGKSAGK